MGSDLPKVMQTLGGTPLLGHIIYTARQLNAISPIYIVCGKNRAILQQAFPDADLDWVLQTEQKGTGHAVQQALPYCKQNAESTRILVLVGDVPLISVGTLQRLLDVTPSDALGILVAQVAQPDGLGRIIRDEAKKIIRIVEHRDATEAERQISEINTGIMLCPVHHLTQWLPLLKAHNDQKEYYLTDIIEMAVQDRVPIYDVTAHSEHEVQGINNFWQLAQLERHYQRQQAEKWCYAGVKIVDPMRIDIRGSDIQISSGVVIDVNVVLEGKIRIGSNVVIGPGCILKNCEIEESVIILPYSILDGVYIRQGSQVGPFSRIRPGTFLDAYSKVGNFVEMKNTRLGPHSKANHLAYLGDADIGSDVNIGAGAITCNYDGVRKSQTIIKEGAFIGSNACLIAPVIIEARATIGAGSVITKDVPSDQLSLARAPQKTVAGWKRKRERTDC